jgi:tetratricopeptide (TPR) repeat protein
MVVGSTVEPSAVLAQTTETEDAPTAAAPDPPPEESAEPATAHVASKPSTDTRAAAMRAYQKALEARKLGVTTRLSRQLIAEELAAAEAKVLDGRRDEAIGDLVYLVENPRFDPFLTFEEGRAAIFLLGDALGRAGAIEPARGYLLRLLDSQPTDTWYRRAVRTLVDLGLESDRPEIIVEDLGRVPPEAPAELVGDVAYLEGRAEQRARRPDKAIAAFARVTPRSRFWAQATYLSGLIEVNRGALKRGEQLFCKVADHKQTPREALAFGGSDFFKVRDLARLGLGRVAHEEYRFDDARYYYYLVPNDSDVLPEALYEAATGRYEAKDYRAARDLVDELQALDQRHSYEDEVWLFDAYVDLATCEFPRADEKLRQFLAKYEPVRNAARRLARDDTALRRLVDSVRSGSDPAGAGLGVRDSVARSLGALLRVDAEYGRVAREVAQLDHEMSGLRRAMAELDDARRRLASPKEVQPRAAGPVGLSEDDQLDRVDSQLAEVRRLLRDAEASGKTPGKELEALRKELEQLQIRARAARTRGRTVSVDNKGGDADLIELVARDRARATELHQAASAVRQTLLGQQNGLAKDALVRLDRRLSRLLRRARLGRIETVLGKKRSLEVEIEALSQGLLPRGAVDSLEAARYLRDDEEYWPFDGEDWADEYVGGEGLR